METQLKNNLFGVTHRYLRELDYSSCISLYKILLKEQVAFICKAKIGANAKKLFSSSFTASRIS